VREIFEEYADPDDPLQSWRKTVPPTFKGSYVKWRRTFIERCYQFVRLSKKDVKNPARNLDNRARQLVAFATRIKPIHLLIWPILLNRIPKPNPKGPPTGVSTYCHLEGVPDKDALDFVTLVRYLSF